VQCARLTVPFDRADPGAGSIALAVQRVPASAPRAGVVVLLAGGPGQPALPPFEELLAPLARDPALRDFELVAFDQRGTGQSQGLQCLEPTTPEAAALLFKGGLSSYLSACGEALGPTRSFYTSQESVEDLDSLRQALGGARLSLFAVSYGTRVAGIYAREHPQGVTRMVLDSTTPLAGPSAIGLERLRALRRVIDEGICGAGGCRSFSRDVYADLTRVVGGLHRHVLHARIYDAHGRLRPARVTEAGVLRLLSSLDVSQSMRAIAPAAIAAAAHGDARPLARLTSPLQSAAVGGRLAYSGTPPPGLLRSDPFAANSFAQAPELDSESSFALFAATYCIENELPWPSDSAPGDRAAIVRAWLTSLPAGATAPFAPATAVASSVLAVCKGWPATTPAPPSPSGPSKIPTLILSGTDDLRTPYEQALAVAAGYSDGRLLRVPDVGHSTVSTDPTGCARTAMIEFVSTGATPASCGGSTEAQALPLPAASLGAKSKKASRSGLVRRVAAAAASTLEDLFGQTGFAGGGLRGGSWARRPNGFVLHAMRDVFGVALSGDITVRASAKTPLDITGHLVVRGRLAGELTLGRLELSGRLGGAHVRVRLAAA
jgi:pimeloyl-ACP methyl ester carboxylesterase